MDVATYLRGAGLLTLAVVPLIWGAGRLRLRLLPGWAGGPAALASSVLFLAMLLATAQALGAVGLFRTGPVVMGTAVVGAAVGLACGSRSRRAPEHRPPGVLGRGGAAVGVLSGAVVAISWAVRTTVSVNGGILDFDSLNYHLPFAARFIQHGHILPLQFTSPGSETPFDPANSELVHGFGMLMFHRDILSPFVNLGWLVLALLAAWCVGRRWGLGFLTMTAGAVVLACPLMVSSDAGSAKNDVIDVFLLLGAVAVLLHADDGEGGLSLAAVGVAAAAAGLGLGNKLTLAVPVVALTVAVVVMAGRGRRRSVAAVWLPVLLVTGGFWFARNLALVGNPVPSLRLGVGRFALPSPSLSQVNGRGFSVAHYLTDTRVWHVYFVRGLARGLGSTWPLVVVLVIAGVVTGLARRDRMVRTLAAVAAASVVAYLFTPESAGGRPGRPDLFANNFRYAFPAVALALVVLVLAAGAGSRRRAAVLSGVLAAAVFGGQLHWVHPAHLRATTVMPPLIAGVGLLVLGALVLIAAVGVRRRLPPGWAPPLVPSAALAGAVAIAGLGVVQPAYLHRRYADVRSWDGARQVAGLDAVYRWVHGVSHARIAVVGLDEQYPLAGTDLSNQVQYVGQRGPHAAFERTRTCAEWRRQVNSGHYDYIVTAKDRAPGEPYEEGWTVGDPGVSEILHVKYARVFRVMGLLEPRRCP